MPDLLSLPKADLHVHLDDTIRPETLREIAASHGLSLPPGTQITSPAAFFRAHDRVRTCLRSAADFHRIAVELCADEAAQGTRYAEVSFTAAAHGERLGDMQMPLRAALEGLTEGQASYGLQAQLVLDHSRRRPVERAWQTLRLAEAHAGRGVIAVGLAGDEAYRGTLLPKSSGQPARPDCMLSITQGKARVPPASGRPSPKDRPSASGTASGYSRTSS